MDASQYAEMCKRTECDQIKARVRMYGIRPAVPEPLDLLTPIRLNHAMVGMMGELGEISQLLERWVYYGETIDPDELKAEVGKELGDVLWYVALACNALGLDMSQVMEANEAKLKARYPIEWEAARAARENRDTEAEVQAAAVALAAATVRPLTNPQNTTFDHLYRADQPRPSNPTLRALDDSELGRRFLSAKADHPRPFGYEPEEPTPDEGGGAGIGTRPAPG